MLGRDTLRHAGVSLWLSRHDQQLIKLWLQRLTKERCIEQIKICVPHDFQWTTFAKLVLNFTIASPHNSLCYCIHYIQIHTYTHTLMRHFLCQIRHSLPEFFIIGHSCQRRSQNKGVLKTRPNICIYDLPRHANSKFNIFCTEFIKRFKTVGTCWNIPETNFVANMNRTEAHSSIPLRPALFQEFVFEIKTMNRAFTA